MKLKSTCFKMRCCFSRMPKELIKPSSSSISVHNSSGTFSHNWLCTREGGSVSVFTKIYRCRIKRSGYLITLCDQCKRYSQLHVYCFYNYVFFVDQCYSIIAPLAVSDAVIKKGRVGIPLTSLITPPCCACPKLGPCHMLRCFLCTVSSVKMRGDCFVDIGWMDNRHC